jgi:outer membrane protein assembly factor BamA
MSGCCASVGQARWFVLPAASYTGDLGWVVSCDAVYENPRLERYRTTFEYYFGGQGQIMLSAFLPRAQNEWTFEGRYQLLRQKAYSQEQPSDLDEQIRSVRRYWEFLVRCDVKQPAGLFYGWQANFKSFEFGGYDTVAAGVAEEGLTERFEEGLEYAASLRLGFEGRDNRYDSRRGHYALCQLDLGRSRSDDRDDGLIRTSLDLRRYFPMASPRTVAALNFRSGLIHHQVPFFSRFNLGGGEDLRGFPLDRYSGNAFYLLRAELRQILKDSLTISMHALRSIGLDVQDFVFSPGLAIFSDGGDLWREDRGWWGFRQGLGAGFRVHFPPNLIGSVDLARAVDANYWEVYMRLEQSF